MTENFKPSTNINLNLLKFSSHHFRNNVCHFLLLFIACIALTLSFFFFTLSREEVFIVIISSDVDVVFNIFFL
jgi:hypothetical protein